MKSANIGTISARELNEIMYFQPPNNKDRRLGYVVVSIVSMDEFREEHIPRSINIPISHLEEFCKRFDPAKRIILYSDSRNSSAPPVTARRLVERGFQDIMNLEGGMDEWKRSGFEAESPVALV